MYKNLALFIVAFMLFLPLSVINVGVVISTGSGAIAKRFSGYFLSSAKSIDKFANVEFRALWRLTMIANKYRDDHFPFGDFDHTVSYVLGKNKADGKLSTAGIYLVKILNLIDKDHVEKAVKITEDNLKR